MAGENLFTQIPPSSTGDRIHLRQSVILPYSGKGATDFVLGASYTLTTTGITVDIHTVYPTDTQSGFVWCHLSDTAIFEGITPTTGENINDVDGNTIATVAEGYFALNTNANTTVGYNNPHQGQFVDQFGSAHMRVQEGNLGLDAFGKLRTSGNTILGDYTFSTGVLSNLFSTNLIGESSVTWDEDARAAVLTVGDTIGDTATHTSNTYHHYLPGSSHQFMGTFALGDNGKVGLTRYWGLCDSKNGFMFTQKDGVFGVTIRSSASGTTVDTFIEQANFNKDHVDGTDLSRMNLDLTLDNIYWIDIQWLGGGRVRFGTYFKGERIVMHEYYGGNTSIYPLSQTASLPTCFSQINTAGTASPSTMKSWCQVVTTESEVDIQDLGAPRLASLSTVIPGATSTSTYHYLGSLSAIEFIPGSTTQVNRSLYFPGNLAVEAWDTTTGDPVVLEFETYYNPVVSGMNFQPPKYLSTVHEDKSGTFIQGANSVVKRYFRGSTSIPVQDTFTNLTNGAFKNNSENGGVTRLGILDITTSAIAEATFDISSTAQLYTKEHIGYTISGVSGMTEVNGTTVYPLHTSISSSLLYLDPEHTQPLNTLASGSYTGGGIFEGYLGSANYFSFVAKKQVNTSNDIAVKMVIEWRELEQ